MTNPILSHYAVYYDTPDPHITIHKLSNCSHYKQQGEDGKHEDGKIHWFLAETYDDAQAISKMIHKSYPNLPQNDCQKLND